MTVLQTQAKLGGATSFSGFSFGSNVTSGSRIVVAISWETPTVSAITVSDTHNGAYTLDATSGTLAGSSGNGGGLIQFYSVANTFSGALGNVSIAWTTSSAVLATMYEVSPGSPFDTIGTAKSGTGSLTSLAFTITPTFTDFVVSVGLAAGGTFAVDSGYTFPANSNGITFGVNINVDDHCHEYNAAASGLQSLNCGGTLATGASMFAAAYGTGSSPNTATIAWVS
jgi:hypothetical protein